MGMTKAITHSRDTLNLIEKGRNLAKKLRCPTFRQILRSAGVSMATLDVKTRWNSIYSMVKTELYFNDGILFTENFLFFIVESIGRLVFNL